MNPRKPRYATESIESWSGSGYLDVAETSRRLVLGAPPAWRVVEKGLDPVDRSYLYALYTRFARAFEALTGASNRLLARLPEIRGEYTRLYVRLSRVHELVKRVCPRATPGHRVVSRRQCRICSVGLLRAIHSRVLRLLSVAEDLLKELRVAVRLSEVVGAEDRGVVVRLYAQRLYELYALYLLLRALAMLEPGVVKGEKPNVLVYEYNGGIVIFYNTAPRRRGEHLSRLARGTPSPPIPRSVLEAAAGRPDITMVVDGRVVLILEVKYSRSPSYLTLARFKTIAYIHEYNARLGVLLYPGNARIDEGDVAEDEDVAQGTRLLHEAEKHGMLRIQLKDNAALYIVTAPPRAEHEARNIQKLARIVGEAIRVSTNP